MNILPLFVCFELLLPTASVRQLAAVAQAVLTLTGRITMLSISRWTEKGGSYRTVQRFFATRLPWSELLVKFFHTHLFDPQREFILAGDATTVTKAGAATHGLGSALLLPAVGAAVVAVVCALVVIDPPRPSRAAAVHGAHLANPYRGDRRLLRIHAISVLLVVPQFTVLTFSLVWLVSEQGWSLVSAGSLVAAAQVLGAVGRLGVGAWSDRVGSRLRPLRIVAVAVAVVMGLLAVSHRLPGPVAVAALVAATVVTVAPNGLAFTSVAEIGGPWWAGRALGAQNTAQFFAGAAVPPLVGALVGGAGYPLTFAVVALLPLLAVPLVPVEPRGPRSTAAHSRPAALSAR